MCPQRSHFWRHRARGGLGNTFAVLCGVLGAGALVVASLLWTIANDIPENEAQIKLLAGGFVLGALGLGAAAVRWARR